ncbi:MAG: four helix bundle protein [Deltaproteobacteria bacterium]|nr:four helix bundle protein [Deltaproteobacteria bacterium]
MKIAHENLEVWNKAVDFAVEVIDTVENISTDRRHYRLLEQIEASSTSIAMNIAEGKGRFSNKEFIQYCYIARGSLYETMTLLEIFRRKRWISDDQYAQLESSGKEIVSMIKGLINSISTS